MVNLSGIFPDIFLALQPILNFTYTTEVSSEGFGVFVEATNSWTGMVGKLERREVDMSMCGFGITAARAEIMDYTMPIYQDTGNLFQKKPKANWNFYTFLEVYASDFWVGIGATGLTFILTFMAFKVLGFERFHLAEDSESFGFQNSIGIVGMSLIQQEYPTDCKSLSSRVLLLTTFLTCFLVWTTYCATLTSVLTLEQFSSPVQNLRDVYDLDYRLLVWKGTVYESYFSTATDKDLILKKLWNDRIKTDEQSLVASLDAGIEVIVMNIMYALKLCTYVRILSFFSLF